MFNDSSVNLQLLRKNAYNLRWATVPEGVIPLTAADPDFPCAPAVAEAVAQFANNRYFSYGPAEGLPEFREAMARFFEVRRNVRAQVHHVLAVDSAAFGIYVTCQALLHKGDEAIIFDPVDFLFRYSIETVGGVAVPYAIPPGTNDIDFAGLEALVTPRTKLICLCNPLNPTGKVFTAKELTLLGEIACRHNLWILSDEIWSDIVFAPHVFTSIAALGNEIRQRTIVVTGFSKSYGLAGLRMGALLAPNDEVFEQLLATSLHRSTVHGANTIGQVAATAALDHCGPWLNAFIAHLQRMRDLCVDGLNGIPGFKTIAPEGCYVAFADITGTGKSSEEVRNLLYNEAKVAVVPGLKQWFGAGAEGYIRLSFATSEEIVSTAITRIKNTIS